VVRGTAWFRAPLALRCDGWEQRSDSQKACTPSAGTIVGRSLRAPLSQRHVLMVVW
jgi:hypothetical protein